MSFYCQRTLLHSKLEPKPAGWTLHAFKRGFQMWLRRATQLRRRLRLRIAAAIVTASTTVTVTVTLYTLDASVNLCHQSENPN